MNTYQIQVFPTLSPLLPAAAISGRLAKSRYNAESYKLITLTP
jgi:hypothetical protein